MSKLQKFYIVTRKEPNSEFIEVPEAKPVVIEGFREYEFFVHRPFSWEDKEFHTTGWEVSEARTGMSVAVGWTLKETIGKAQSRLVEKGKGELDEAIKHCVASTGLSPWYNERD